MQGGGHHHPSAASHFGHQFQQQQQQQIGGMPMQLPDTIPDFGTGFLGAPSISSGRQQQFGGCGPSQNDSLPSMGFSPQPPSAGLAAASGLSLIDPTMTPNGGTPMGGGGLSNGGGGPYLFHQTPSGSTLCQLGGPILEQGAGGGLSMCSPGSSQSGSQPRLVHLSGGTGATANDSGLSSLSGGFGCPSGGGGPPNGLLQQHNFSPAEMRGELEELEPVPRDRCNTWPLRRAMGFEGGSQAQTSPLIHDRIPEEESMYEEEEEEDADSVDPIGLQRMSGTDSSSGTLAGVGVGSGQSPGGGGGHGGDHMMNGDEQGMEDRSDSAIGGDCGSSRTGSPLCSAAGAAKKSSTRRNAWGNLSYADLITQAILASPEKRLTLSQVYEWMVQNVPYFRDKGDSNSSAGWKNSIRHNLSLHSRFMRIQNEGAGKSSWWVINPDAKPGRNPRRRANTMESASKAALDKKRRGARKRVEQLVQQKGQQSGGGGTGAGGNSLMGSMQALFPDEAQDDAGEMMPGPSSGGGGGGGNGGTGGGGNNFDTFRPRAQSTLSVTGPSRLSPKLEPTGFEDFDFPPWMDQSNGSSQAGGNGGPQQQSTTAAPGQQSQQQVNELLDRTDQMRLDGHQQQQQPLMNGIKIEPLGGPLLVPKTELLDASAGTLKMDGPPPPPTTSIPPPPSYQELSAVRRPVQIQSNPLLRQLGSPQQQQQPQMMSPLNLNGANSLTGVVPSQAQQQSSSIFASTMVPPPPFGQNFQWNGPMPSQQQPVPVTSGPSPLLMGGHPHFLVGQSVLLGPGSNGLMGGGINNNGGLPLDLENVNADQSLFTDLDVDAVLRHELAQGGQFDLP